MSIYYLVLIISIVVAGICRHKNGLTSGEKQITADKMFIMALAVFLSCVTGLRYHVGADFNNYVAMYLNRNHLSLTNILASIFKFNEAGYDLICYISSRINDHFTTMFLITALCSIIPVLFVLYRNTSNLMLSMFLFITLVWDGSFGAIRQFLAASIVFCGYKYICNGNVLKYIITVFIASLFHTTALVMIPLYFFFRRDINLKNVVITFVFFIVLRYSYDFVYSVLGAYKGSLNQDLSYMSTSVNIFRVVVAFAPSMLLLFVGTRGDDQNTMIAKNIIVIHGLLMFSMANSAYLARAAIYTTLFLPIAIPKVTRKLRTNNRGLVQFVMVVGYFAYWVYGLYAQNMYYTSILGIA